MDSPEEGHICFNIPVFASKRLKLMVKGLKSLAVLKTCLSPIYLYNFELGDIHHHTIHIYRGLSRTWFLKRSLLRLLQLFLSRACITELYLFLII